MDRAARPEGAAQKLAGVWRVVRKQVKVLKWGEVSVLEDSQASDKGRQTRSQAARAKVTQEGRWGRRGRQAEWWISSALDVTQGTRESTVTAGLLARVAG